MSVSRYGVGQRRAQVPQFTIHIRCGAMRVPIRVRIGMHLSPIRNRSESIHAPLRYALFPQRDRRYGEPLQRCRRLPILG